MKKRTMKKYIPKRTQYCYGCRWRKHITTKTFHRDTDCEHKDTCNEECWTKPSNSCLVRIYRCEFLNYTDWNEDSLLWDGSKECGISEISDEEYNFMKYYANN